MIDILLSACLLQATAEDRLKALEEKLTVLEQRQKTLETENAALEKKAEGVRAARETWARQSAAAWVKRHAPAASFSEGQAAELEKLWTAWTLETATADAWKLREADLRARLSPEQQTAVSKIVREDQEKNARAWTSALVRVAKIPAERAPAFEKAVLARLPAPDGALIFRPVDVRPAIESGLGDLTEAEQAAVRETLSRWKK